MTGYEEFLTVPEVATLLRCSAPTVHKRIRTGLIPAIKSGDAANSPVRIRRTDLDRYLAQHEVIA